LRLVNYSSPATRSSPVAPSSSVTACSSVSLCYSASLRCSVALRSTSSVRPVDERLDVVIDGRQPRQNLQRWLSPPDPSINHRMARTARHESTAARFFHDSVFNKWKSTPSLMWIHGQPGSGRVFSGWFFMNWWCTRYRTKYSSTQSMVHLQDNLSRTSWPQILHGTSCHSMLCQSWLNQVHEKSHEFSYYMYNPTIREQIEIREDRT